MVQKFLIVNEKDEIYGDSVFGRYSFSSSSYKNKKLFDTIEEAEDYIRKLNLYKAKDDYSYKVMPVETTLS